jgi:hypothetical protein
VASVPHYDYDHRFNYRKGYLRDDKVPAFISTALHQIERKKDKGGESEHHYLSVGPSNGAINEPNNFNSNPVIFKAITGGN